jgi:hypothetical protein
MATNEHGVLRKNWLLAFVISLLLGGFGVDRFYLGRVGTGILKLLTFGGLGIWALIDFIMIATKNINGIVWENDGKDAQKKAWIIFAVAVIVGLFISVGVAGSKPTTNTTVKRADTGNAATSTDSTPAPAGTVQATQPAASTTPAKAAAPAPAPAPAAPSATVSQKNALSKAKEYLAYTSFSHDGLVAQLEYEKFSTADATYGADNVGADWNVQADKKAKEYMGYSSFSRGSLIDQLKYDKFTQAQAEYGANSVGL